MINVAVVTDQTDEITAKFKNVFFTLGKTTEFAQGVARLMADLKSSGKVGNRVAMVNVADTFGIELSNAAKPIFKRAGFKIVYDSSYPLGLQDISPVISSVIATKPDVFIAFSYPPDSFALKSQAAVQGLKVDAFYTAIATNFPAFSKAFGEGVNGHYGIGGANINSAKFIAYKKAHIEVTGEVPDYWASAVTYASFQVLEQAIEGVGSVDRTAVTQYIKDNNFDTVMGQWDFINQQIQRYWTVGQWQNNKFYGIGSTGKLSGAVSAQ